MHDVLRVLGERARAGSHPGKRDDGYRVVLATDGRYRMRLSWDRR